MFLFIICLLIIDISFCHRLVLMLMLLCAFCNLYYAIIHIQFIFYLYDGYIVFYSLMTAKNVNIIGISYSFVCPDSHFLMS